MTRKEFITGAVGVAGAAMAGTAGGQQAPKTKPRLKLGVSTYSYNGDIMRGAMTLEDVLADIADLGAEGVELISEGLIPDYPNPPERWVTRWFRLLDQYELVPTTFDCFVDTRLYLHRPLREDELVDQVLRDLKLAHRLGFKMYRGMGNSWDTAVGPPGSVWDTRGVNQFTIEEKCLATAEKLDVKMCGEIHTPARLKSPWIDRCLEFIARTKTKHFGFNPDFGIFSKKGTAMGMKGKPASPQEEKLAAEILRRAAGGVDPAGGPENPKDLIPLLPYCYTTHAKFTNVTEDLTDPDIPYDQLIRIYAENGYEYYLNSEYEGDRSLGMAQMQLRRQHCMIRRIWDSV